MAADLKASVVPPVSRSPKMCFISPRHNKSGVSPSGPLFISMKVINLVWSDTTFVLLLYTLDNKWCPRIFTQSTALFDSTLPTFPTLGARLWTPSPGSHNTPNKKQEADVLLEFHLYCNWAFFYPDSGHKFGDLTALLFTCYTRWTADGVHTFSHSWLPFNIPPRCSNSFVGHSFGHYCYDHISPQIW